MNNIWYVKQGNKLEKEWMARSLKNKELVQRQ